MVPADGSGRRRRSIGGDASDSTPRYSPDGKRIAFISSRDGSPQVYVADANGGGGKKVTNLSMGAQPPLVFSGTGTTWRSFPTSTRIAQTRRATGRRARRRTRIPSRCAPPHAPPGPTLGRVAREHPPSRLRCGRRGRQDRRRDARRLRLASGRRRTRRLRSLPTAPRSRTCRAAREPTRRRGPRTTTCGWCRRPADRRRRLRRTPRPTCSRSIHTMAGRCSCARSADPGSSPIAGTSTPTIAPRGEAHGVHRARHLGRGLLAVA